MDAVDLCQSEQPEMIFTDRNKCTTKSAYI